METIFFKEWFVLNEGPFEDQALSILNQDKDLLNIVSASAPEPKYTPIVAYFYRQSTNISTLKDLVEKYKQFVDNKKLPMIQITKRGAFLNNQEIDYLKFAEIVHSAEANSKIVKSDVDTSNFGLKPIFDNNRIKIYKAKNAAECVILGRGFTFCISNPNAGLNMWNTYRNSYDSTFYFVFEKIRQKEDPLRIVVVDARKDGDYALTDADNNTGKISEFNNYEEYFGYLHSVHNINAHSIFVNDPKTQEEIQDYNKVSWEIATLQHFKELTFTQKEKYIGNGHELTDEQFNYLFENNLNTLIIQYINTGIKLNTYQISVIFKNPSYKKSYLRQRLAVQEHLNTPDIGRIEYLALDDNQKSKINLDKINKLDWFVDSAYLGDEEYVKEHLENFTKNYNSLLRAFIQAIMSNNLSILKIIDNAIQGSMQDDLKTSIGKLWNIAATYGNVETIKYIKNRFKNPLNIGMIFYNISIRNDESLMQYLAEEFELKDKPWYVSSALGGAIEKNAFKSFKVILNYMSTEDAQKALESIATTGNLEFLKLLLSKYKELDFENAILKAIENNKYNFIEYLLKIKNNFEDKQYLKFLNKAISTSNFAILKLLVKNCSNKNLLMNYISSLLENAPSSLKRNKELYDYLKKMKTLSVINYAKILASTSVVNDMSEDQIKQLFRRILDDEIENVDIDEIRNVAKEAGHINIYNVLNKSPFLIRRNDE